LTTEQDLREQLIRSFTEPASRLTEIDRSTFVAYLRISSSDNVTIAGELRWTRRNNKGYYGLLNVEAEKDCRIQARG